MSSGGIDLAAQYRRGVATMGLPVHTLHVRVDQVHGAVYGTIWHLNLS